MEKLPRGRKRGTSLGPAWHEEPKPEAPTVFSSMFTNAHGDRWYAVVDKHGHLRFWGEAIDCQYVYCGHITCYTAPILMSSEEQEWLKAMHEHMRTREFHLRKTKAGA